MLKQEIQSLQKLLNNMICSKEDYSIIYEISAKLDELIVDYYNNLEIKAD